MSEKFGLDWKDADFSRMNIFYAIMGLLNERESGGDGKMKEKYGRHAT